LRTFFDLGEEGYIEIVVLIAHFVHIYTVTGTTWVFEPEIKSKEVIRCAQTDVWNFGLARRWVELQEIILHELVDFHYGGLVTAPIAVVGCGENGDYVAFVRPVVAIHDELVGARDSCQVVRVVELLANVLPEAVPGTARADTPATSVVRVRPEQVADRPLVWRLLHSVQLADLVQRVNARREATVQAEHLVFYDCGKG